MDKGLIGKKILLEGNQLFDTLSFKPKYNKKPIIKIGNNLVLDDSIIDRPTCIIGNSGSGKTTFINNWIEAIVNSDETINDNVIIFAAKNDMLRFAKSGDIIISLESSSPENIWNLISELDYSDNPSLMAKEISYELFEDQQSTVQPFLPLLPEIFLKELY